MCFLKSFGKSSRPARVRKLQNDAKKITAPPAMRDRAALNLYRSGVCKNADSFLTALSQARLRNYFFFADLAASSSRAACAAAKRATGTRNGLHETYVSPARWQNFTLSGSP